MKIQFASDLHLEFPENWEFLKRNPIQPVGEILILAGDIVPFAYMNKYSDFFKYLSDNFAETYWLPGNHEYYHFDLADKTGSFFEKIMKNVYLLNNKVINVDDIDFIFSTLWTEITPARKLQIESGISDFYVIKYKGRSFTSEKYNSLHHESLDFLKNALHRKSDKSIVISHHVPTYLNYPEKYKGSVLNDAFAVELYDLVDKSGPGFWIYGHSHFNTGSFRIGRTTLLTNQLGYVKYNEQLGFSNKASFVI